MAPPPPPPTTEAAAFAVGQAVWVRTERGQEESGTVVRLGCARPVPAVPSEDGSEDDRRSGSSRRGRPPRRPGGKDDTTTEGGIALDGVMVELHAGGLRAIHDPQWLRPYEAAPGSGRASRRASAAVTPSPHPSVAGEDADRKPAAKRKARTGGARDAAPAKKKAATPSATPLNKRLSWRKPGRDGAGSSASSGSDREDGGSEAEMASAPVAPVATGAKRAAKRKVVVLASSDSSDAVEDDGSDTDGGGNQGSGDEAEEEDRPFVVDYAPTGRATCRRCDQAIDRGSCRVSHVPLFRGKPGFRIYRHLECAQFTEEIHCVQDVGGWRNLNRHDLESLSIQIEASRMEIEQENREISPDELVQVAFAGEVRKSPPGLSASLLPFQVEGVSWMYHQEVRCDDVRGGILADEMGMGKTIQTITTILDNRSLLQHSKPSTKHPPGCSDLQARLREDKLWATAVQEWHHEMTMNNVSKKQQPKKHAAARAGTLIVCPVIALSQWKAEIEKFTESGALKVGVYHGPNRTSEMPLDKICKYDVVLTTYQVIETDFRKMTSPNKVACPNCGAKFKIDKLAVHLKYFCGEGAQRTEAQARQRRTADRPGRRTNGNSSRSSSKHSEKKKKPLQKTTAAKTVKSRVRVAAHGDYESDSELSMERDAVPIVKRSSRSAAAEASNRLKRFAKDWDTKVSETKFSDSDSAFSGNSASSSNEDSDDPSDSPSAAKKATSVAKRSHVARSLVRSSSDGAGSDEDAPVTEAILRQQKELEKFANAKGSKKKVVHTKTMKLSKRQDKKNKFEDSSSEDGSDVDPMAGIDMDELIEEAMSGAAFSPLHAFTWWRIVLDEAHYIKSRSSQTAAAAFSFISVHRWCLSGTPLQNRVGELYSLIRFLRLDPMAHYICRQKDCSCKSLHYRMKAGQCQDCGHRAFTHYSHFNRYVLNPIQREGYTGDGRRAVFKLKEEILDKCLLRRTKETKAADMNLPPRIVKIRAVRLHPVEQDFYNALYTQTKSSFDDYVAEGTLLNNYAHIFDLLTRLRQAVDHPYLIVYSHRAMKKLIVDGQQSMVANGSVECAICDEPFTERVTSSCCGAGFCRACVIEYISGAGVDGATCPSCERPFTIDLNQKSSDTTDDGTLFAPTRSSPSDPTLKELPHVATGSILRRINLSEFATSSKIEVLVQELVEMRQKRPGSKALVFSQFVNMLDLIRWRLHSDPCLQELGLGVQILHGGMDAKSRDQALADFRENNKCRVLLMSLKAAGVALNLTVASECFLMDLWWNPAAELQAIDRTHRLGQYRPIRAVRLVAEGTVEERVLQLQEKKRLVFDGTVGRDAASLKMLTVNDMVNLFQG